MHIKERTLVKQSPKFDLKLALLNDSQALKMKAMIAISLLAVVYLVPTEAYSYRGITGECNRQLFICFITVAYSYIIIDDGHHIIVTRFMTIHYHN